MTEKRERINYIPPYGERTDALYVPSNAAIEQIDDEALRRGLCFKSGGRLSACAGCKGCAFGRELARRASCEK